MAMMRMGKPHTPQPHIEQPHSASRARAHRVPPAQQRCSLAAVIRLAALLCVLALPAGSLRAQSSWDQPAAALAGQIADALGPGPAHLTIQNVSALSTDQIPAIRRLLAQHLRARGISLAGPDSANLIRVTLSENARERLWVAEIAEGDDTKVVMVELPLAHADAAPSSGAIVLRRQPMLTAPEPILAVLEMQPDLIALEPQQIVIYAHAANGWQQQQSLSAAAQSWLARDPRGVLLADNPQSFEAWLPGVHCAAAAPPGPAPAWSVACHASDDPWTLDDAPPLRAFYNAARNYFTGVLIPDPGPALPPFYSLAVLPRSAGTAVLIGGIDGSLQIVENGALHAVDGARDWGSDFAALQSGCGAGTQIVVSGSGDAPNDSLRAYEIPASQASPVSEPLDIQGTVMALSTAPDRKSVIAIVRNAQNVYEVDRVTALCN